jgi:hypothetical protein
VFVSRNDKRPLMCRMGKGFNASAKNRVHSPLPLYTRRQVVSVGYCTNYNTT